MVLLYYWVLFGSYNIHVFLNYAQKFNWLVKRMSYAKADSGHLITVPKG